MADLIDKKILRGLVPPNVLNTENFAELAGKTYIEKVLQGKTIFNKGDMDRKSVYLIEGRIELRSGSDTVTVVSGSETAKHPLANQQPRQYSATATAPSRIIRIDSDLLDVLLAWDQLAGIEVDEIHAKQDPDADATEIDVTDWMTRVLQTRAFLQIPPANIQALFMRVREVRVKAGDTIIREGDEGDYYYMIQQGRCKVTRSSRAGSELTLATLGAGDAFGEEALLSEAKRNADVVMLTDGILMRLSKQDFNELLKEPMLSWVSSEEADKLVNNEGAVWVDVRLESEYKNSNIAGSINIPLFTLRLKAETLDPDKQYILYCNHGRQSSACAYLLSERGLKVHCLKGGLVERSGRH